MKNMPTFFSTERAMLLSSKRHTAFHRQLTCRTRKIKYQWQEAMPKTIITIQLPSISARDAESGKGATDAT
jgi:hypothetical protein